MTPKPPPTPTGPDPTTALLAEAAASEVARHRRKAEKVKTLLDELRADLDADREARAVRAEAKAEVQRLERALAQAKAKLRGGTASTIDVGPQVDSKTLRAWAGQHGVACPVTGRVPNAVREAYAKAHQELAAS